MIGLLVTGATGLVGVFTIRKLVRLGHRPYVLVRGRSPGSREIALMAEQGLVRSLAGDITQPGLGLAPEIRNELREQVGTVLHLAADYRLSIDASSADKTNLGGTENLLDVVSRWNLRAFHHVSSIVVAGDCPGLVAEAPIEKHGHFRNEYERSKWLSEQLMVKAARRFPVRIYRPGVIVGDSRTGETTKFDGPYAALHLARKFLPFIMPGDAENSFPLVSVDLVADVLTAGLAEPPHELEILHVLDSDPPTVMELTRAWLHGLTGHEWIVRVPRGLASAARHLPGFHRMTGLEPQALEYLVAKWTFSTDRFAVFCERHGIERQRVKANLDALLAFYALQHGRRLYG